MSPPALQTKAVAKILKLEGTNGHAQRCLTNSLISEVMERGGAERLGIFLCSMAFLTFSSSYYMESLSKCRVLQLPHVREKSGGQEFKVILIYTETLS